MVRRYGQHTVFRISVQLGFHPISHLPRCLLLLALQSEEKMSPFFFFFFVLMATFLDLGHVTVCRNELASLQSSHRMGSILILTYRNVFPGPCWLYLAFCEVFHTCLPRQAQNVKHGCCFSSRQEDEVWE